MKPPLAIAILTALVLSAAVPRAAAQEEPPTPIETPFLDGQAPPGIDEVVRVSTEWSADGVAPGGQVILAVKFKIAPGWHIQLNEREKERDWMIGTRIELAGGPPGTLSGDTQWPEKHKLNVDLGFGPEELHFYEGDSVAFLKVSVPAQAKPGDYPAKLSITYQACDDKSCLAPVDSELVLTIRVLPAGSAPVPNNPDLFAKYGAESTLHIPFFGWDFDIDPNNLALLWLVAALGGLLLNFTPCVLPLIPIKIIGLSKAAGHRGRCFALGGVMSLGVVAFWLGMGYAVASVTGFTSTNELFQYPAFTLTVGLIIALMAAGMMGAFAVGLPQWVYTIQPRHDTLHGSFAYGIMTAVLSTPCTAPLMGAAIAWAATQSRFITLTTFTAVGAGMALPYLVLSAWPALVSRMPRTGPASELIKQVMGLLLLAAAAYFVGTGFVGMLVTAPDPPSTDYWWAVAAFIVAAGFWMTWRTFRITRSAGKQAAFASLGAVMIALAVGLGVRFTDHGPIDWVYYTPQRLEQARAENKIVMLEFTAQWCLNCHALEQAVLRNPRVVEAIERSGLVPIKVDLTGNNEPGNALLNAAGSRTIPLLVIYDADGHETLKSDAYTVDQVLDAIARASQ